MKTQVSYEQLEYDVDNLQRDRDVLTKAIEDLLTLIDDCELLDSRPGLAAAFDRVEALL
jgi:hypothetical protein